MNRKVARRIDALSYLLAALLFLTALGIIFWTAIRAIP